MEQENRNATELVSAPEQTFRGLRRFNAIMGVFHLAQFALMLALSNNFALPITTLYLRFDSANGQLVQNLQEVGELLIGPATAVFLLLSALAHFSLATFGYRYYVRNLKMHINRARWYEYALSSSLMIVIIAMLNGMYDLSSLILIFTLNAMMILFGYMMELHNQTTQKTDWTAFISRLCLWHRHLAVSVFQQLCRQHVAAVPQGWALEGLSVRRAYVHCAEPGSQVCSGLADLFRHLTAFLDSFGLAAG